MDARCFVRGWSLQDAFGNMTLGIMTVRWEVAGGGKTLTCRKIV